MGAEPLKNGNPNYQEDQRSDPVSECFARFFPEAYMIKKAVPVSVDQVIQRIEPYDPQVLFRNSVSSPEYRRKKECQPHQDGDDIIDIGKEKGNG